MAIFKQWAPGSLKSHARTMNADMPAAMRAARERATARQIALRTRSLNAAAESVRAYAEGRKDQHIYNMLADQIPSLRGKERPPTAPVQETVGVQEPQVTAAALALAAWQYQRADARSAQCSRCGAKCECGGWRRHRGQVFTGQVVTCVVPGPANIPTVMLVDAHNGCIELHISPGAGALFTEEQVRSGPLLCSSPSVLPMATGQYRTRCV